MYHKSTSEDQFHMKNCTVTSYMIGSLNPNTQYIVYVQAVTDKGVSMPSETLIAWTDPAYPAFVEVREDIKSATYSCLYLKMSGFLFSFLILLYKSVKII